MNKLKEALANRRLSTFAATTVTNVTSLLISSEIRDHSVTKLNELVNVTVNREKCNHQLASNVIRSRYANCEIVGVSYV